MAINSVTLGGRLTRDAELRRTQGGTPVLNMGMAVNNRRKNNQTGQWEDDPCYVDCVLFGTRAEKVAEYLRKGAKVTVQGKLRYSSWEKDGQKRSKLDVILDEIEFMSQSGGQSNYGDSHQQARRDQAEYVQATYYDEPYSSSEIPF